MAFPKTQMTTFEYILPAIRGIQAGREYYVSMCPIRLLSKLLPIGEEEIPPQKRSQRLLSRGRVPKIARYVLENPTDYAFSAIAVFIDGDDIVFEPGGEVGHLGKLRVPLEAQFKIADGQHRRVALELALRQNPKLRDESIPLVMYLDVGLKRSQQMFADLNRYSVRPSPSLTLLYDYRDRYALITRAVVEQVEVFAELTEYERSTLAKQSPKLFTLSAIYRGNVALLADLEREPEEAIALAVCFWRRVGQQIPDWREVLQGTVEAAPVRREKLHTSAIALIGFGKAGALLLELYGDRA